MPRSKRKAAAARAGATGSNDFEKKKTKLGKRRRSDSLVNASAAVRSRKIYVPPQETASHVDGPRRTAAVLDHVSRARDHFNAHARATALTALARMYTLSSSQAPPSPTLSSLLSDAAPVLRVALEVLQDGEPFVRGAALSAVLAVLRVVPTIEPFAGLLSSSLCAALSHIRTDIRVSGARSVARVFELNLFSAGDVFSNTNVNPLPLLANMLGDPSITSSKARTAIFSAIVSISCWQGPDISARSKVDDRVFHYHRRWTRDSTAAWRIESLPLLSLDLEYASDVVSRVANTVSEYFPLRESFQRSVDSSGTPASAVVVNGARALSTVVCEHTMRSERVRKAVSRCVDLWAKEQVFGTSPVSFARGADDVNASMASVAALVGSWDVVSDFVCGRLRSNATGWVTDSIAARVVQAANVPDVVVDRVVETWLDFRWQAITEGGAWSTQRSRETQRACREKDDVKDSESIVDSDAGGDTQYVLETFEAVISFMSRALPPTRRKVWGAVQGIPKVVRRLAVHESSLAGGGDVRTTNAENPARCTTYRLLSMVGKTVRQFGGHTSANDLVRVGDAMVSELIGSSEVMQWLSPDCFSRVVSVAGYCGFACSGAVLRLISGKRCGWVRAALAARVVEVWSSMSTDGVERSKQSQLEILAGALAALQAGLNGYETSSCAQDFGASAEDTARADVVDTATRIVQKLGVDRSSVEAILVARGASGAQVRAVVERCVPASLSTQSLLPNIAVPVE